MGAKPRAAVGLSDAWCRWVLDNLLADVDPDQLVDILVDHQVPRAVARRDVGALSSSHAALGAARAYRGRIRQLELIAELPRRLAAQAAHPDVVERRSGLGAAEFFDRYWATNQPVVWTDLTADWAARSWTPRRLADRFGAAEVEACVGRAADADPDMNWREHARRMSLTELIDRVEGAGHSNDVYLIANNHAIDLADLADLAGDVAPDPELFDPARLAGGMSLWIGPAGTVTPLHHDTTNIAFNQLYGRKRIRLIPPTELRLLEGARGFYAGARLDQLELDDLVVREAVVGPGDSLFIPAGWWHEVESLDVSISLSLLCFRRPNDLGWFAPANVLYESEPR